MSPSSLGFGQNCFADVTDATTDTRYTFSPVLAFFLLAISLPAPVRFPLDVSVFNKCEFARNRRRRGAIGSHSHVLRGCVTIGRDGDENKKNVNQEAETKNRQMNCNGEKEKPSETIAKIEGQDGACISRDERNWQFLLACNFGFPFAAVSRRLRYSASQSESASYSTTVSTYFLSPLSSSPQTTRLAISVFPVPSCAPHRNHPLMTALSPL